MKKIVLLGCLFTFALSSQTLRADKINFYQYKQVATPFNEVKQFDNFKVAREDLLRTSTDKINKAYIYGEVLRYLLTLKTGKKLNLPEITSENFQLQSVSEDEVGISVRVNQRYKRIKIINSTAVFLFDKKGSLLGVNSSLAEKFDDIDISTHISAEVAERIAYDGFLTFLRDNIKSLESNPLFSNFYEDISTLSHLSTNDKLQNLRIEFIDGKPVLLWEIKFYISGDATQLADQLDFVKFYIDAKTGKVVKFNFEPYFAINMNMYDAQLTSNIIPIPTSLYKVIKIMEKGEWNFPYSILTPPDYAQSALDNITKTLSFYKNKFNRNSYDNAGSVVDVVVNVARYNSFNPMQSNAAWIPDKKMFIFGAGNDEMSAFVKSLDIVAHEYTHAVISSTSNLDYSSQTGAINESLADTFGFFVDDDDYLIGEDLLLKPESGITAIRNMKDPKIGVKFPQPDNTDSAEFKNYGVSCSPTIFNDSCGVHILSGITNKAAYLIIEKLGKSKSAKIYYRATTERLKSNSDFIDLKNQLFESCLDLSKVDSTINDADCKYIKTAFLEVGIK